MTAIPLVLLVDADPPSDVGGGRGFYPQKADGAPPDPSVLAQRFAAIESFVADEAGGCAAITVHTSPRFRFDLIDPPHAARWRALAAAGALLALHPHEDRADGTRFYDDAAHLRRVVDAVTARARRCGLTLGAFRGGGFSFNAALPDILARHDIALDLSSAPGLADRRVAVDWPASVETDPEHVGAGGARMRQVPLGWDGVGCELSLNYLFNEKTDFAGLARVFDAMRQRADRRGRGAPAAFLVHGFGLVDPAFRAQAGRFLRHALSHGAALADARRFALPEHAAGRRGELGPPRHCEEHGDEAIRQLDRSRIASLRSQ